LSRRQLKLRRSVLKKRLNKPGYNKQPKRKSSKKNKKLPII